MEPTSTSQSETDLFKNKRNITQFQILIQIVEHQPAINQTEIAESVGLTPQTISEHLRELANRDHVEKLGRGRYEVTKEGVNWLISQATELQKLVRYVDQEILGGTDVESAIATDSIQKGQRVTLSMRENRLHATPGTSGPATAVAVTSADAGRAVGVTSVEGVLRHDPGRVTIITVPPAQNRGCRDIAVEELSASVADHDMVATDGIEATVAARLADIDPDIEFGVPAAVSEAAMKGSDVMALVASERLPDLTEQLRSENITREILDGTKL